MCRVKWSNKESFEEVVNDYSPNDYLVYIFTNKRYAAELNVPTRDIDIEKDKAFSKLEMRLLGFFGLLPLVFILLYAPVFVSLLIYYKKTQKYFSTCLLQYVSTIQ